VSPHQRLAHGALDLLHGEWLGDHVVHQRIQPMRSLALIGIAGHQHDRDFRMTASGGECERDAVHHRHLHVGQQQVEFAVMPVQCIERGGAVGCRGQVVAVLTEGADDEVANGVVVFGYQDSRYRFISLRRPRPGN
jgi:hypothetical protein